MPQCNVDLYPLIFYGQCTDFIHVDCTYASTDPRGIAPYSRDCIDWGLRSYVVLSAILDIVDKHTY